MNSSENRTFENRTVANENLLKRMEALENKVTRVSLQLASIQGLLEHFNKQAAQAEIPTQWVRPKDAADIWGVSESALRKWRTREWKDGSFQWIEGVHWKKRGGYNRAIVDHWFTYRHDWQTHQDYIRRWLKASNQLPKNLQK